MDVLFIYFDLDPCSIYHCLNGGTCHHKKSIFPWRQSVSCLCPKHYYGRSCENKGNLHVSYTLIRKAQKTLPFNLFLVILVLISLR